MSVTVRKCAMLNPSCGGTSQFFCWTYTLLIDGSNPDTVLVETLSSHLLCLAAHFISAVPQVSISKTVAHQWRFSPQ
jgi:hypothetical protein